jgi:hypothetical protein
MESDKDEGGDREKNYIVIERIKMMRRKRVTGKRTVIGDITSIVMKMKQTLKMGRR